MARPSTFTQEIADKICERIASGESVRALSQDPAMPEERTIYRWLIADEVFCQKYTRAREQQAEVYAQEIVSIADECEDPAKARLQVDARKWAASKLAPKKYGDKLDLNHGGQDGNPVVHRIERKIVRPND